MNATAALNNVRPGGRPLPVRASRMSKVVRRRTAQAARAARGERPRWTRRKQGVTMVLGLAAGFVLARWLERRDRDAESEVGLGAVAE